MLKGKLLSGIAARSIEFVLTVHRCWKGENTTSQVSVGKSLGAPEWLLNANAPLYSQDGEYTLFSYYYIITGRYKVQKAVALNTSLSKGFHVFLMCVNKGGLLIEMDDKIWMVK